MKVLTAAEMRAADRRTMDAGIPSLVLMENAGVRVVEYLERHFAPLSEQRIVILCGKGNNGGDGLVIARQLHTRVRPRSLDVILTEDPPEHLVMLEACGCPYRGAILPEMRAASIVIDALLGTGLNGVPREPYLSLIDEINHGFPAASIVAVDIPSGMSSDDARTGWRHVVAHHTITFTAPQPAHVLEPNASACGRLHIAAIGTRDELCESDLNLAAPADFSHLFAKRTSTSHKGDFGHVLVVGGAAGKTGAASMTGLAALRAGAGLVTVASSGSMPVPELMTEPLGAWEQMKNIFAGKTMLAIGPGIGTEPAMVDLVRRAVKESELPVVVDADGLNALCGWTLPRRAGLILTPHPGEMSRLSGLTTAQVQGDRAGIARSYAVKHGLTLVLKGRNTLTALPDGQVWVNPTGGPAMATGGSGDILTGLIAGLVAQFPNDAPSAVLAAVWLHGRSGDLAAARLGEKSVIATDLIHSLPAAMEECARLRNEQ